MGFLGFIGFTYFDTGEPYSLFWFSFLGYLSIFWVGRLAGEMKDERFVENNNRAKQAVSMIAPALLFCVGFLVGFTQISKEVIILICSLGYSGIFICYALLFWHYDKN